MPADGEIQHQEQRQEQEDLGRQPTELLSLTRLRFLRTINTSRIRRLLPKLGYKLMQFSAILFSDYSGGAAARGCGPFPGPLRGLFSAFNLAHWSLVRIARIPSNILAFAFSTSARDCATLSI